MIKSLLFTLLFMHMLFALNVPPMTILETQNLDKYEWVQLTGAVEYNSEKTVLLSDPSGSITVLLHKTDHEKQMTLYKNIVDGDTITVIGEYYPSSTGGRVIPFQCVKKGQVLYTKSYELEKPFPQEYNDNEFQQMLFAHRSSAKKHLQKKSVLCTIFLSAGISSGIVGTVRINNTEDFDFLYQLPLYGILTSGFLGGGISQLVGIHKAESRYKKIPHLTPNTDKKVSLNLALRKTRTETGLFVVGTF